MPGRSSEVLATLKSEFGKFPAPVLERFEKSLKKMPSALSDDQLAAFEKAWNEVVKEESAKDATFKEFADSFYAFRKNYAIWGDAQALKSTYVK